MYTSIWASQKARYVWECQYSSKVDCPCSRLKDDECLYCVPMVDALPLLQCLLSPDQMLGMQYPHLHFTLLDNLICLPLVLQWYFSVLVVLGLSAPIEFPCVGLVLSDMCRATKFSSLFFACVLLMNINTVYQSSIHYLCLWEQGMCWPVDIWLNHGFGIKMANNSWKTNRSWILLMWMYKGVTTLEENLSK